ncbi:MAG: T9SS type A sorting domain-containing protein [Bacteroidales bacterium]|nr:T9SS type A sorting domain-containing protein [Bacteroidales bacterium]
MNYPANFLNQNKQNTAYAEVNKEKLTLSKPKKSFIFFLLFLFVSNVLNSLAQTPAPPSAGDGSAGNPYQINSIENFHWLRQNVSEYNKYFLQTADIDASPTSGWNAGAGLLPIGSPTNRFKGHYDGNGFVIDGLYINSTASAVALFGYCDSAAIMNLGLTNADITGNIYVGGFVGASYGTTHIENCFITGTVTGASYVGGFAANIYGETLIKNCHSECSVTGSNTVGGFVSQCSAVIENSYCSGEVTGSHTIGGFSAYNNQGLIEECYSATIENGDSLLGGFVGFNYYSTIKNCYSTGNCYLYSNFDTINTGGFCGLNTFSAIENCYLAGGLYRDILITIMAVRYDNWFVGNETGVNTLNGNFVLWPAAGTIILGASCKTIEEMQADSTFTNALWNFDTVWVMSSKLAYDGYPHLQWENSTGYANAPERVNGIYQVSTLEDLQWITENDSAWSSDFVQVNDIEASQTARWLTGWYPIAKTGSFTGTYDGRGYSINNILIKTPGSKGLFGNLYHASVTGVTIDSLVVETTGSGSQNGSLAGYCDSSIISHCSAKAYIKGGNENGGLIGKARMSEISFCYTTGEVSGADYVGGLIGYADTCIINNCYSNSSVSGTSKIGGLTGHNNGEIKYCYYEGNIVGFSYIGGLSGTCNYNSSILLSYSLPVIQVDYNAMISSENFGGLVGSNGGNISNCYSIGNIYGHNSAITSGGIVGYLVNGLIENSYASVTSSVHSVKGGIAGNNTGGSFNNCFWDSQASALSSAVGTGIADNIYNRTTSQMKQKATFTAYDWDFTGEEINGSSDCWHISNNFNNGYPDIILPVYYNANISFSDKVYDGNTVARASAANIKFYGQYHNHHIEPDTVYASFEDKNTGTNKNIAVDSIDLNNPYNDKYKVMINEMVTGTASIHQKELLISGSFTAYDKLYDGTATAAIHENNLELTGIIADETIELDNIELAFAQSTVADNVMVNIVNAGITGSGSGNYILSLTGAPVAYASITDETGVEDPADLIRVVLYPNPCNEILFFDFTGNIVSIHIIDISGKTLVYSDLQNNSIDTGDLGQGYYTIKFFFNDGKVFSSTFIKK